MRALIVLALGLVLSACTMLYKREYLADTPSQMSAAEVEQAFVAFRDFLIAKGVRPQRYGAQRANSVAFQIAGSDAGFAFRHDWADVLELSYSDERGFRLQLSRIVHHPADFSDAYLKQFVEQTEGFLREATNKPIRLKLISGNGT